MHVFTTTIADDSRAPQSQQWELEITYSQMKRVHAFLGIDLMHPDRPSEEPVVLRLQLDLEAFVNVVWCLIQKQGLAAGVTDEQFGAALDDAAFRGLREAFFAEWEDFFARSGATVQAAALRKQIELFHEAGKRIAAVPAASFLGQVDEALASLTAGPSVTSLPASSESTPAPTPSAGS